MRVIVGDNVVEAVRGMDELDDDVLEVNNCQTKCPDSVDKDVDSSCSVTPSQWSKGVALQTAKGPLQVCGACDLEVACFLHCHCHCFCSKK